MADLATARHPGWVNSLTDPPGEFRDCGVGEFRDCPLGEFLDAFASQMGELLDCRQTPYGILQVLTMAGSTRPGFQTIHLKRWTISFGQVIFQQISR